MSYKEYQNARDASWKILIDCEVKRLPIDLNVVCRKLGVRVLRYESVRNLPEVAHQTDGLTYFSGDQPVILYDQSKLPERIRFTVAHELGHIVLGHIAPGEITIVNREPTQGDNPMETAANQFAARLMAPACVLWGLGLHTPEEISGLCYISKQSAEFRASRMEELYKRGKFLSSPLERQVYEQFQGLIKEYRPHYQGE